MIIITLLYLVWFLRTPGCVVVAKTKLLISQHRNDLPTSILDHARYLQPTSTHMALPSARVVPTVAVASTCMT